MEVSANIDWISSTYKYTDKRSERPRVLPDDHKAGYQVTKPKNGYDTAIMYPSGAMEMWNSKYPKMGIHVSYSAQAIAHACENFGCEQWEVLDYLSETGKLSRLDIALDVRNVQIDIRQLHQDALNGKIKTRVQSIDYVESAKRGQEFGARTLYIGSMKKRKKLLRVYDKGMQLNLDDYLTRFELETHGEIARNAALSLLDNIDHMASTISGMIRGYADMSESVPDEIFTSQSIKIALPKYKRSNTAQWLIDTVAKTLAKEVYTDYNVMESFMSRFKFEYEQILAERQYNE